MKVLFVGPYPPPHGGISVHVWSAQSLMKRTGQQSSVLNIDRRAPESEAYIKISGALDFLRKLVHHARNDWTFDVHTNGHNAKSWAIAFACGAVAQLGPGASLTLHSGMAPDYIRSAPAWIRCALRLACVLYQRVVCVNADIASAVAELKIPTRRIRIAPAFLFLDGPQATAPREIENWIGAHSPLITSTLFFRPEYGFELLLDAVRRLRCRYPQIGCLVVGTGEDGHKASALVASQGLNESMLLAGDVDHDVCLSLIARATVFVRPALHDGDSISVREAVALGVPVVASNVGTRPSCVRLFEPGDLDGLVACVEQVLSSRGLLGPEQSEKAVAE